MASIVTTQTDIAPDGTHIWTLYDDGSVVLQGPSGTINVAATPLTLAQAQAIVAANTTATNRAALDTKAAQALTANATYLALASPSTAQNTAQIKALTRQANALLRLVTDHLDDITGT